CQWFSSEWVRSKVLRFFCCSTFRPCRFLLYNYCPPNFRYSASVEWLGFRAPIPVSGETKMQSRKFRTPLLIAVLVTVSSVASAASFNKSTNQPAQNKDTLSGKYEGVAKSDQMGDIRLTVEIKNDNGKLTG